jgi:hypothetical protein
MRTLAVAIVVSTIIVAFAFRYAPVVDSAAQVGFRHWSFDHWTGDFHQER